jgi:serine/threonine protein kinase
MDVVFERRAMDLFERAVDRPEDQRQSWIEGECGADAALAQAVSALLRTLTDAQRRLPTEVQVRPLTDPEASPPARIGPYRLTQLVGVGGMGWVYRGERDDGLFAQTVAVKLIKSGLVSAGGFGRFSTERKILAGLRHPGIARLYDGGADEAGRPYMIMEFIHGRPIDAALEGATSKTVVQTMIGVCAAVQSAHQALVVHADLKPGNILVEVDGSPRLVDFGIGQLLSETGDEMSRFGMTPAYASPQRRAGQRPATADDIFALGVVLHELLSLAPPSDPLPVASDAARSAGPTSATGRAKTIKGDLDAIVIKATATDAADRYASVGALADDLQRWLDGFPVQARPRSPGYVLSLFVRRHPLAVAGAGLAWQES